MSTIIRYSVAALATALFAPFLHAQSGGTYELTWSTFDGGGGTSSGGIYSITGTIGQPDAGGPMTGGSFSVMGGFWSLYAVPELGSPALGIKVTATNTVMIYWPSPSSGFNPQVNTNLVTTNWTGAAETVQDNGTIQYIIVNPPTGNRFYRLKK
jgi:hypothetical protein